jgi:hypothetical protein
MTSNKNRTGGLATVAVLALTLAALLASPASARATDYSVIAIENPSNYIVTFSVRYGTGPARVYVLSKNQNYTISVPATGDSFHASFSTNIGYGGGTKEYRLLPALANNPTYYNARKYYFQSNGRYLDIYQK